jgi:hypothetical protein
MTVDEVLSLPALSVRQPWASMIISGMKTVELRSWPTNYRGWLWIHSGKKVDQEALDLLDDQAHEYQTGGLLGIAHLTDVRKIETPAQWQSLRARHRSPSRFQEGAYGWHFDDAIPLRRKIPALGEVLLFPLALATREAARTALEGDLDFLEAIEDLRR